MTSLIGLTVVSAALISPAIADTRWEGDGRASNFSTSAYERAQSNGSTVAKYVKYGPYNQPSKATGINGFSINISTPSSSATVQYWGKYCNGDRYSGSSAWVRSGNNRIYFTPANVCSFSFQIVEAASDSNNNRIDFKLNYDFDF
ncbi:MAG: hypothetical protein WBB82_09105 [Limnothrix sp.]